ncbi:MAG: polysaccharide deacetylase family protein [Actinomycetota bacterium]
MRRRGHRFRLSQTAAGLLAIPLSLGPFAAYLGLTPEGRLVADRAQILVVPPRLPSITDSQRAAGAAFPPYRDGVAVLAYHGIGSKPDGEGGYVVSPARFGEHLAMLRAAGLHTVTASEVAEAFAGKRPLPSKALLITFDDGRADAMLFADPLLRRARMRATMFVITRAAGNHGVWYASWERLEGYAASGRWDLQSHTASSHRLRPTPDGTLPALTSLAPGESLDAYRARVRADLGEAAADIRRHTGRTPVALAYPFGAYGADRTNDPRVRRVLREEVARRYRLAFHQDEQEGVPLAACRGDLLGMRRVEVGDWTGTQLLSRIARSAKNFDPPASCPEVA